MRSPMPTRLLAAVLILSLSSAGWAADPLMTADREAVLAKLKANGAQGGLTIEGHDGGTMINLGTTLNGGEANNANDENLRLIAQLPDVERVYLYKGKISADGLSALASLPKLRRLSIYKTDVSPDAFAALVKLPQLKYLSLGDYPVTDEILGYAGQIKGLKGFDHTRSEITPTGFLKFLNGVESLEQLTLFGDFVDDACMQRIGQMKEMQRFWTDSEKITSAGWVHLAGLTKMQDLFLSNTNFGDDDTRALEGMQDLMYLGLNKTKIGDAGMPSLAGLTKLHDLGLDGTKVTDRGMAALKEMTELKNLYVGMTDVTATGLAVVPRMERMVMMRMGRTALTPNQLDEVMQLYPDTQIFDPSGYWTPERVKAAMKELGKDVPQPKKAAADLGGGVKLELVLIPAGKFQMGSGESAEDTAAYFNKTYRENFPADGMGGLEASFFGDEHPQHDVRITKPFFMGTYPVTRGQFRQFVAATAYQTDKDRDKDNKLLASGWDSDKKQFSNDEKYSWRYTGFEQTDEHPVVNVTWNDAMAFCKWLSEKGGQTYRLPTEAEWEYSYRAVTTTRYPSGDDPRTLGKVSNLVDATVKARIPDWKYMIYHSDNYAFTSPVGKSQPNAFGLSDMQGNAFQWCSDWYGEYTHAASPADDPSGPDSGRFRTVRGGTWSFRPLGARSAERNKNEPDRGNCGAGFRVVRSQ